MIRRRRDLGGAGARHEIKISASGLARAFDGGEREKIRHEVEAELMARTDPLNLHQCPLGQLAGLTAYHDSVRADAMCGKLFNQSFQMCGRPENLHAMQVAFVTTDAYQCGYCTSGQIMSGVALLKEPCGPEDADVKEFMSGNICRCGAYQNIVAAIQSVRKKSG